MIQQMLAIWSGSSAFSKSCLNIWKFMVHILLKPCLENFECYIASMWNKCNCSVVWTFLALLSFGIRMKTDLFQSCGHCWVFQICWHVECSTFTASCFRIWNSSTGILSPPLALFVYLELKKIRMAQCLPTFRRPLPLSIVCVSPFYWIMFI